MKLSLPYQPPFDFEGLLRSYKNHQMGDLERFENGKMVRVISFDGKIGQIAVSNDPDNSSLVVEIDFPDTSIIHAITSRVRNMFDLDSDPVAIANSLEADPRIKEILKEHPGIRLASGWDPFEIAISVILGQLVSVKRGRTLVCDLIELVGVESGLVTHGKNIKLFPTPNQLIAADLTSLKTTRIRKQTLIDFSKAVQGGDVSLESGQDVAEFMKKVLAIKGIGAWTANYMALKVLRDTNSFPTTDLILARALELHSPKAIEAMSPWRGYVAALFWRKYAETLKKTKRSKT